MQLAPCKRGKTRNGRKVRIRLALTSNWLGVWREILWARHAAWRCTTRNQEIDFDSRHCLCVISVPSAPDVDVIFAVSATSSEAAETLRTMKDTLMYVINTYGVGSIRYEQKVINPLNVFMKLSAFAAAMRCYIFARISSPLWQWEDCSFALWVQPNQHPGSWHKWRELLPL